MTYNNENAEQKQPLLPSKPTLEQLNEFFSHDYFAYDLAGCRILEGYEGYGVCEMPLEANKHYNAQKGVMGGAVFTLADFALAVASVCGRTSSVSVNSSIEYMRGSRGTKLIATCKADRVGKKLGFYTVHIEDDLGESIAKMVSTCYFA